MASVGQIFTRHPSSSNWSLHLMLFRCWCQNDTALKMSGLKACAGERAQSSQELGAAGRGGRGGAPTRCPPHLAARLAPVSSCGSCWLNHL